MSLLPLAARCSGGHIVSSPYREADNIDSTVHSSHSVPKYIDPTTTSAFPAGFFLICVFDFSSFSEAHFLQEVLLFLCLP